MKKFDKLIKLFDDEAAYWKREMKLRELSAETPFGAKMLGRVETLRECADELRRAKPAKKSKKSKWHVFDNGDWQNREYPNSDRLVLVLLSDGTTVNADNYRGLGIWEIYNPNQVIGWREMPKPPKEPAQ